MLTPSLVVGLTIMAAGVALLLESLGVADVSSLFKFWPIIVVLFGASIVTESRRPVDPAAPRRKGVPCFFLFLLILGMFASMNWTGGRAAARGAASAVNVTGIMHPANRAGAGDFRHGRVAAVMGRSSLDLRQVMPAPGEQVVVDVFVAMGRATVRIPDDWIVDTSALPVMGSVDQQRFTAQEPQFDQAEAEPGKDPVTPAKSAAPPRLMLRGVVMMGKVEITS